MRRNKKRVIAFCAALILSISVIPNTACADVYKTEENITQYTYTNPRDIIIAQPGTEFTTTSNQVSILGACDYEFPIYMNGVQIETTEHGFFAEYVALQSGLNTFTFTNNGRTKVVNITKKSGSSSGGSSSSSNINYWGSSHKAQYITAKGHNISRMSIPGGDKKSLMMPLAQGTVAQIIGEAGNLYCLSDYSFVYKSNVNVSDGNLPMNNISKIELVGENGYDCTELQMTMNQNALYNLDVAEDHAILTIYNTTAWVEPYVESNRIIDSINVLENGQNGYVQYRINLKKDAPMNGHYVEFADGKMAVGFKKSPQLKGDSLKGVRIHIDAGHGGSDSGAKGPAAEFGPLEKDINLNIALYAKAYLEEKGAEVIMTRTDDSEVGLSARAAAVAAVKPDFSLSVHCNSMAVSADYDKISGFLTFYSFNGDKAPEFINAYITNKLGIPASSARYSNLAMTRMTGYPAVLFETSFMSNPGDYEWMIRPETQKNLGEAAGEAVEQYIRSIADNVENSYA